MLFQQNDPRNEEISMSTYPEHKILSHSDRYEQSYGQTADPIYFGQNKSDLGTGMVLPFKLNQARLQATQIC